MRPLLSSTFPTLPCHLRLLLIASEYCGLVAVVALLRLLRWGECVLAIPSLSVHQLVLCCSMTRAVPFLLHLCVER